MLVYILIACDRLDEKQEKKLKQNLPELQAALQVYADENVATTVTLINDCESDDCEDWQLGISQPIKKPVHLNPPVNLFNSLAQQYDIDCEVGYIEDDVREAVSYFGKHEGRGEAFLIAEYLGL
ncbi:hypothetical protein GCM10007421_12250 [Halopseudomonas oceani]|uniref:Uncharacterized protein n=1 Tax=Halopseudomonas oceani TaxID=1708783 RepID=A0A2P4EWX4_9GAMM|nr:hypothetical protein [Halopseudomonas oceani]POB04490.1 hypothetical protein C1949_05805 [Halopseudomonas oceani]GGE39848.1 hypothetical protein GCM10007421_12250 [Halopseudomonas oceani]